ncbi:MAG TPA: type II secretion system major pseudopilin GspG [Steroidobacteraceae bacterium]|nr:type II secretion system major pseudopilin GspG [Steroidobacteraceae bacterium]
MTRLSRRQSGFTLIEIMVVLVIIAILGALIGPQIIGQVGEARIKATKLDLRNLSTALDMYQIDNYRYPTTEQGLEALVRKPTVEPFAPNWRPQGYIRDGTLPKDQWKNPYIYRQPGAEGRPYDLITLGADAKPGGEGEDADFSVWTLD